MSLHYILDGYNIIKRNETLSLMKLEAGRDALTVLLAGRRPQGSSNNKVTVVYDGVAGLYSDNRMSGGVKTLFSQNGSADDKIKHIVDRAGRKKDIVVVTDDRSLRYYVRALGARVLGVKAFLGQAVPAEGKAPRGRAPARKARAGKHIPKTLESAINKEMHQVWLDKKKKSP